MKQLKTPRHCSNWLKQEHSLLKSYQKKAQYLLKLNELWKNYVHKALISNSRIANFQDTKLVIEVENASWGTRLHYAIPDLLIQLQTYELLKDLKKISWYIKPQSNCITQKSVSPQLSIISQEAQQLIHAVASTIVNDELKTALHRLADFRR